RGIVSTTDDGTGVTHSPAFRSGLSGNKAHYRLFIARRFDIMRSLGFHAATNFTYHHNALGFRIVHQHFHGLFGSGADDGVTPDTDGRGLTQARFGELIYRFISKRT